MQKLISFFAFLFLLGSIPSASAQNNSKKKDNQKNILIQFSGVAVDHDSLKPIPFVSIMIKHSNRGTISDYFGYFSFVAETNDTIEFNALGYRKINYIISDTLLTDKYSLIQVLKKDTFNLKETLIYPWPTKEQFEAAFLNLNTPNDDLERAKKNMALAQKKELRYGSKMDAGANYANYMENQDSKLYSTGQYPVISLLNPLAWAKFIEAWKSGQLKVQ
ncbi:MAG: carboxypeptidase-like regulatory domain-containing protein [Bacteroidia bacterium]